MLIKLTIKKKRTSLCSLLDKTFKIKLLDVLKPFFGIISLLLLLALCIHSTLDHTNMKVQVVVFLQLLILYFNQHYCDQVQSFDLHALNTSQPVCSARSRLREGFLPLLHQLLFPGDLEIHHAVFESLDLTFADAPVLVFTHALLHSVMLLCTASAGYHPINGVILIFIFTAAVMGGCHPVPTQLLC